MRKAKREFVLMSFVLSAIAVTLQMVSLGTEQWLVADARIRSQNEKPSAINYGLFKGLFKYTVAGYATAYEIAITCSVPDNACAYICGLDATARENTLKSLLNHENVSMDLNCPSVSNYDSKMYHRKALRNSYDADTPFINYGLYIAATLFFIVSTLVGLFSALLCLWNSTTNPINTYLSIFGIHIYNGITVATITLAIICWSVIYGDTLAKNVCIEATITGAMISDGYASLGYSFWINLPALILYITSDVILYLRNYLVNSEPKQLTIDEVQDPGLMLF